MMCPAAYQQCALNKKLDRDHSTRDIPLLQVAEVELLPESAHPLV